MFDPDSPSQFFFNFFSNIIFSLFTFLEIAFPFDFQNLTSTTKLHSFNVLFASELHLINIHRPSTYHVLQCPALSTQDIDFIFLDMELRKTGEG